VASDNDGNRLVLSKSHLAQSVIAQGGNCCFGAMAIEFCRSLGWHGRLHSGSLGKGVYVFVFENMDPITVKGM
jgi:hypothetical protein